MRQLGQKLLSGRRLVFPLLLSLAIWIALPVYFLHGSAATEPEAEIRLVAILTGIPATGNVNGNADYQTYQDGRRTLTVNVVNLHLNTATTTVDVVFQNATIGHITLNSQGSGQLVLDTAANQTVPTVAVNDSILIRSGNLTVLSGLFREVNNGTPTPTVTVTPTVTPTQTTPAVRLYAVLRSPSATPNSNASGGVAEYFMGPTGPTTLPIRTFKVTVSGSTLPNGTVLDVFVADVNVGHFTINNGAGVLDLRDGAAPIVHNGDSIVLKNGTTVVLAGVFSPNPPPPPPAPHPILFSARLNGQQEVPPVQTNGVGFGHVILNGAQTQIQVFLGAFNLSSNQTGASISGPALPGVNGPVIFDLGIMPNTNAGTTSMRTFPVTAAQVADLRAGKWYFNVRTVNNPTGEVRGQIRAATARADYDGDGRSDISVFRPNTGMWYALQSADGTFTSRGLGAAGNINVQGDYDGDGMTDVGVFDPADGTWRITESSTGITTAQSWGYGTDIPMVGDYDGDGRNDLAVYRASTGIWYLRRSSDKTMTAYVWGASSDRPVSGDFDGDGRTDIAVFRPPTGAWYILRSSDNGVTALGWGMNGDRPVSGDFDGDGRSDIAVFRPSNGAWYILASGSNTMLAYLFGTNGDLAVPGEFDEDSRTDIGVFRPSTGMWYILRSTDGTMLAQPFGASTDLPTPAAYTP